MASFDRARFPMLIGNQSVEALSGAWSVTTNPATNEALAEVPAGAADDVDRAVAAARAAFDGGKWSRLGGARRTRLMFKLADLLWANIDALALLEAKDNGKAIASVKAEIAQGIGELEFFAGAATKIQGRTNEAPFGFLNYTLRAPVGVCALIVPWNYPLMLTLRKLAPALAAGNSVVIKPASYTPLSALVLGELAVEAGFPEGAVNVITGGGATVGAALARHPHVDKVSFTGSTEVGRTILDAARGDFRRVSLELGGKSPAVVFDDADLNAAVPATVWSIFYSAGQSCEARSRIFVHRPIYDAFVERFAAATGRLVVGDPLDPATQVGALITPEHRRGVEAYIGAGQEAGARVVAGGARPSDPALAAGNFLLPTVLADCANDMTVARDEIFGPVACILPFDDEAAAVAGANDTIYGLAASVWTSDIGRAHRMAGAIKSGIVTVNQPFTVFPGTPFGGVKQSGWGREVSLEALDDFTELKSVVLYTGTRPVDPFGLG
ncbi:MAG: aldehyde dehydrogenase family protein [Anaerolineae bacterium]